MLHGGDIYGFEGLSSGAPGGAPGGASTGAGVGDQLDYSVNTNPLAMPPTVPEVLRRCIETGAAERYPDPQCRAVRAALSRLEGVPAEQILCGNGAADLIFRLCLAKKPRRALVCAPTFSEYENAVRLSGGAVVYHVLREDAGFSLGEAFLAALDSRAALTGGVDMAFLCNPNNPAGGLIDGGLLAAIVRRCRDRGILLVVDECFLPFTAVPSLAADLGENLVVLKAFTKTFALAGLRFGYMLCADAALRAATAAAGPCWAVSVPAQSAALAAVECGPWLERSRGLIATEKPALVAGLRDLGLRVFDGGANFVLFRAAEPGPAGTGAGTLYEALLEKHILVRTCGSFRGLDERYYRVAVKTGEQNGRLIAALSGIYGET
jgi:threonine-phosphate decarboxylase